MCVDDTFMLMLKNKIEVLRKLNSYHESIKFTYDEENENLNNFLNMSIIRNKDDILKTKWLR